MDETPLTLPQLTLMLRALNAKLVTTRGGERRVALNLELRGLALLRKDIHGKVCACSLTPGGPGAGGIQVAEAAARVETRRVNDASH